MMANARARWGQWAALCMCVVSQGSVALGEVPSYSPNIAEQRTQLYWGDLHLHTALSADAFAMGGRTLPEDAYRFARGEAVVAGNGMSLRPRHTLDFLAITDHAEYLSVHQLLANDDSRLSDWPLGAQWRALLTAGKYGELTMAFADAFINPKPEQRLAEAVELALWRDVVATADRFNEPHLFTALVGYEWTSTVTGDNLHRVVLYKEGAGKADTTPPFSTLDSNDPEKLWRALAHYERQTGGEVLAIPHNSNVSNGRMFATTTLSGAPLTREYAEQRARWEPLLEVTQVKGDSETHPLLSPKDRYANFERWDEGNINMTTLKAPGMIAGEYARAALKSGLGYQHDLGANPYQFGLIGSSDSHTGYSAVAEDNFFGKFQSSEPSAERMFTKMAGVLNDNWRLSASGLTAVWAQENTRTALFDALRRREVYGTTGSRIRLRFFAGSNFTDDDLSSPQASDIGYQKGVPMGGVLHADAIAAGRGLCFLVWAMKEPDGADLHALQVVKGWRDLNGEQFEHVYDIALAGNNESDGAGVLRKVWNDPTFDPAQDAFYYARVIEVPRPRWTTRDAAFFSVNAPTAAPQTIQDRAYSSPIWYRAPAPAER